MGLMWSSTIIIEVLSLGTCRAVRVYSVCHSFVILSHTKTPMFKFYGISAKLSGDTILQILRESVDNLKVDRTFGLIRNPLAKQIKS